MSDTKKRPRGVHKGNVLEVHGYLSSAMKDGRIQRKRGKESSFKQIDFSSPYDEKIMSDMSEWIDRWLDKGERDNMLQAIRQRRYMKAKKHVTISLPHDVYEELKTFKSTQSLPSFESAIVSLLHNQKTETKPSAHNENLQLHTDAMSALTAYCEETGLTSINEAVFDLVKATKKASVGDEKKVIIMKRIHELQNDGKGNKEIANALNEEGIKPLRGETWTRVNVGVFSRRHKALPKGSDKNKPEADMS